MGEICEFGDNTFHKLVYKPEYRTQVLHEAACCNLDLILFVVADEAEVIYSVLIHFPSHKRRNYIGILEGVYNRTLSWAYTVAWDSNDPMKYMPKFRQQIVSSPSYHVDRESLCFTFFVWTLLREMVEKTQLPLPIAYALVPVIVTRWNRCKGRIDEMTRLLSHMNFVYRRASAKQILIMRELKKLALSTYFIKKHCFPSTPPLKDLGYQQIQSHIWGQKTPLKHILYRLATEYTILDQAAGVPTTKTTTGEKNTKPSEIIIVDGSDPIDKALTGYNLRDAQKQASRLSEEFLKGKRKIFDNFASHETLNKNRRNVWLNHTRENSLLRLSMFCTDLLSIHF